MSAAFLFEKMPGEEESYSLNFANRLAEGETIDSAQVHVQRALLVGDGWEDVSGEFVGLVSFAGTSVTFSLIPAIDGTQDPHRTYRILAEAGTTGGRTIIGDVELEVRE